MRRELALTILIIAAGCSDATPPILNPVVHDVTLTYTAWIGDFNSFGVRERYPMNTAVSGTLAVDFRTQGALFSISSAAACLVPRGRVSVSDQAINGEFADESQGGPRLTLGGTMDSSGKMSGSFLCQSRTGSPHYISYEGTYVATPRP
jgi:hypothetical protein